MADVGVQGGNSSGPAAIDTVTNTDGLARQVVTISPRAGGDTDQIALLALESGGNLATVAAAQGVGGTSITQPTGGSGILGWLSGIYNRLVNGSIAVTGTFWQATQPVSLVSLPALAAGTNSIGTVLVGQAGTDGSTSITTGGTAQNLFGGATPTNGFEICNPDPAEDLWVSDSTTAAINGQGSYCVAPGGGTYTTPPGYKPIGAVSVIGATTGHKITARRW